MKKVLSLWKVILLVISGLIGVAGVTVLSVYLTGGFDEKPVPPEDLAVEKVVDGQGFYNEDLGRFEVSSDFKLTISTTTENVNQKTITLSLPDGHIENRMIENDVLIVPQTVTLGTAFDVKLKTSFNAYTNQDWINGGLTTITAKSENILLESIDIKVAVDVPVYRIDAEILNASTEKTPTALRQQVVVGSTFEIETNFIPQNSKYLYCDQTRVKKVFYDPYVSAECISYNFTTEKFEAKKKTTTSTNYIDVKTFANSYYQELILGQINETNSELLSSRVLQKFAELEAQGTRAYVSKRIYVDVLDVSVNNVSIEKDGKNLNQGYVDKVYRLSTNSATFDDKLGLSIKDSASNELSQLYGKVGIKLPKAVTGQANLDIWGGRYVVVTQTATGYTINETNDLTGVNLDSDLISVYVLPDSSPSSSNDYFWNFVADEKLSKTLELNYFFEDEGKLKNFFDFDSALYYNNKKIFEKNADGWIYFDTTRICEYVEGQKFVVNADGSVSYGEIEVLTKLGDNYYCNAGSVKVCAYYQSATFEQRSAEPTFTYSADVYENEKNPSWGNANRVIDDMVISYDEQGNLRESSYDFASELLPISSDNVYQTVRYFLYIDKAMQDGPDVENGDLTKLFRCAPGVEYEGLNITFASPKNEGIFTLFELESTTITAIQSYSGTVHLVVATVKTTPTKDYPNGVVRRENGKYIIDKVSSARNITVESVLSISKMNPTFVIDDKDCYLKDEELYISSVNKNELYQSKDVLQFKLELQTTDAANDIAKVQNYFNSQKLRVVCVDENGDEPVTPYIVLKETPTYDETASSTGLLVFNATFEIQESAFLPNGDGKIDTNGVKLSFKLIYNDGKNSFEKTLTRDGDGRTDFKVYYAQPAYYEFAKSTNFDGNGTFVVNNKSDFSITLKKSDNTQADLTGETKDEKLGTLNDYLTIKIKDQFGREIKNSDVYGVLIEENGGKYLGLNEDGSKIVSFASTQGKTVSTTINIYVINKQKQADEKYCYGINGEKIRTAAIAFDITSEGVQSIEKLADNFIPKTSYENNEYTTNGDEVGSVTLSTYVTNDDVIDLSKLLKVKLSDGDIGADKYSYYLDENAFSAMSDTTKRDLGKMINFTSGAVTYGTGDTLVELAQASGKTINSIKILNPFKQDQELRFVVKDANDIFVINVKIVLKSDLKITPQFLSYSQGKAGKYLVTEGNADAVFGATSFKLEDYLQLSSVYRNVTYTWDIIKNITDNAANNGILVVNNELVSLKTIDDLVYLITSDVHSCQKADVTIRLVDSTFACSVDFSLYINPNYVAVQTTNVIDLTKIDTTNNLTQYFNIYRATEYLDGSATVQNLPLSYENVSSETKFLKIVGTTISVEDAQINFNIGETKRQSFVLKYGDGEGSEYFSCAIVNGDKITLPQKESKLESAYQTYYNFDVEFGGTDGLSSLANLITRDGTTEKVKTVIYNGVEYVVLFGGGQKYTFGTGVSLDANSITGGLINQTAGGFSIKQAPTFIDVKGYADKTEENQFTLIKTIISGGSLKLNIPVKALISQVGENFVYYSENGDQKYKNIDLSILLSDQNVLEENDIFQLLAAGNTYEILNNEAGGAALIEGFCYNDDVIPEVMFKLDIVGSSLENLATLENKDLKKTDFSTKTTKLIINPLEKNKVAYIVLKCEISFGTAIQKFVYYYRIKVVGNFENEGVTYPYGSDAEYLDKDFSDYEEITIGEKTAMGYKLDLTKGLTEENSRFRDDQNVFRFGRLLDSDGKEIQGLYSGYHIVSVENEDGEILYNDWGKHFVYDQTLFAGNGKLNIILIDPNEKLTIKFLKSYADVETNAAYVGGEQLYVLKFNQGSNYKSSIQVNDGTKIVKSDNIYTINDLIAGGGEIKIATTLSIGTDTTSVPVDDYNVYFRNYQNAIKTNAYQSQGLDGNLIDTHYVFENKTLRFTLNDNVSEDQTFEIFFYTNEKVAFKIIVKVSGFVEATFDSQTEYVGGNTYNFSTKASFAKTTDKEIVEGKEYFTNVGGVYTKVDAPKVEEIATYYEKIYDHGIFEKIGFKTGYGTGKQITGVEISSVESFVLTKDTTRVEGKKYYRKNYETFVSDENDQYKPENPSGAGYYEEALGRYVQITRASDNIGGTIKFAQLVEDLTFGFKAKITIKQNVEEYTYIFNFTLNVKKSFDNKKTISVDRGGEYYVLTNDENLKDNKIYYTLTNGDYVEIEKAKLDQSQIKNYFEKKTGGTIAGKEISFDLASFKDKFDQNYAYDTNSFYYRFKEAVSASDSLSADRQTYSIKTSDVASETRQTKSVVVEYVNADGLVLHSFAVNYNYNVVPNVRIDTNYPNPSDDEVLDEQHKVEHIATTNDGKGTQNFFGTSAIFNSKNRIVVRNAANGEIIDGGFEAYVSGISNAIIRQYEEESTILKTIDSNSKDTERTLLLGSSVYTSFVLENSSTDGTVTISISINGVTVVYKVAIVRTSVLTVKQNAPNYISNSETVYAEDLAGYVDQKLFAENRIISFVTNAKATAGTYYVKATATNGAVKIKEFAVENVGESSNCDLGEVLSGYTFEGVYKDEKCTKSAADLFDEVVLTSRIVVRYYDGRKIAAADLYENTLLCPQDNENQKFKASEFAEIDQSYLGVEKTFNIKYKLNKTEYDLNSIYTIKLALEMEVGGHADKESGYTTVEIDAGNEYKLLNLKGFDIKNERINQSYTREMLKDSKGTVGLEIYGIGIAIKESNTDKLQNVANTIHNNLKTSGDDQTNDINKIIYSKGLTPVADKELNNDGFISSAEYAYARITAPLSDQTADAYDYTIKANGASNDGNYVMMRLTYSVNVAGKVIQRQHNLLFKIMPNSTINFKTGSDDISGIAGETYVESNRSYQSNKVAPYKFKIQQSTADTNVIVDLETVVTANMYGQTTNTILNFFKERKWNKDGTENKFAYADGKFSFDIFNMGKRSYKVTAENDYGYVVEINFEAEAEVVPTVTLSNTVLEEGKTIAFGTEMFEVNIPKDTDNYINYGSIALSTIPNQYTTLKISPKDVVSKVKYQVSVTGVVLKREIDVSEGEDENTNIAALPADTDVWTVESQPTDISNVNANLKDDKGLKTNITTADLKKISGVQVSIKLLIADPEGLSNAKTFYVECFGSSSDSKLTLVPTYEISDSASYPTYYTDDANKADYSGNIKGLNTYLFKGVSHLDKNVVEDKKLGTSLTNTMKISKIEFWYNDECIGKQEASKDIVSTLRSISDEQAQTYMYYNSKKNAFFTGKPYSTANNFTIPNMESYYYGTGSQIDNVQMKVTLYDNNGTPDQTADDTSCEMIQIVSISKDPKKLFEESIVDNKTPVKNSNISNAMTIYDDNLVVELAPNSSTTFVIDDNENGKTQLVLNADGNYVSIGTQNAKGEITMSNAKNVITLSNDRNYSVRKYVSISENIENARFKNGSTYYDWLNGNRNFSLYVTEKVGDVSIKYKGREITLSEVKSETLIGYTSSSVTTLETVDTLKLVQHINDVEELNSNKQKTEILYFLYNENSKVYRNVQEFKVVPQYTQASSVYEGQTNLVMVNDYITVTKGTSKYYILPNAQSHTSNGSNDYSWTDRITLSGAGNSILSAENAYKFVFKRGSSGTSSTFDENGTITTKEDFGITSHYIMLELYIKVSGFDGNFETEAIDSRVSLGTFEIRLSPTQYGNNSTSSKGAYSYSGNATKNKNLIVIKDGWTADRALGSVINIGETKGTYTFAANETIDFAKLFDDQNLVQTNKNYHLVSYTNANVTTELVDSNLNSYSFSKAGKYDCSFVATGRNDGDSMAFVGFKATIIISDSSTEAEEKDILLATGEAKTIGLNGEKVYYVGENNKALSSFEEKMTKDSKEVVVSSFKDNQQSFNVAGIYSKDYIAINDGVIKKYNYNFYVTSGEETHSVAIRPRTTFYLSQLFDKAVVYKVSSADKALSKFERVTAEMFELADNTSITNKYFVRYDDDNMILATVTFFVIPEKETTLKSNLCYNENFKGLSQEQISDEALKLIKANLEDDTLIEDNISEFVLDSDMSKTGVLQGLYDENVLEYVAFDIKSNDNPNSLGLYEVSDQGYVLTKDLTPAQNKTYYTKGVETNTFSRYYIVPKYVDGKLASVNRFKIDFVSYKKAIDVTINITPNAAFDLTSLDSYVRALVGFDPNSAILAYYYDAATRNAVSTVDLSFTNGDEVKANYLVQIADTYYLFNINFVNTDTITDLQTISSSYADITKVLNSNAAFTSGFGKALTCSDTVWTNVPNITTPVTDKEYQVYVLSEVNGKYQISRFKFTLKTILTAKSITLNVATAGNHNVSEFDEQVVKACTGESTSAKVTWRNVGTYNLVKVVSVDYSTSATYCILVGDEFFSVTVGFTH